MTRVNDQMGAGYCALPVPIAALLSHSFLGGLPSSFLKVAIGHVMRHAEQEPKKHDLRKYQLPMWKTLALSQLDDFDLHVGESFLMEPEPFCRARTDIDDTLA
jgi:hypothetical protein